MRYKINKGDVVSDYLLACNMLEYGDLEIWEDGVLIDVIDYETAKYEVERSDKIKNTIEE